MLQPDYKPIEDCPICLEPIERIYTMINSLAKRPNYTLFV